MHFSSRYLTLALAFATGTLAIPQQYERQTTTQPPSSRESGGSTSLPSECHMFKPYVAEIFLEAICSLHMNPLTPGQLPAVNSECFGAGASHTIVNHGNTYQPQQTSLGGGNGYTQVATPTKNPYQGQQTTQRGGYQGQQTSQGGGAQQTTQGGGYQARPTTTSSSGGYEY
ncbi:MAG: hypothetical protein L6R37_005856 [Teloschistes peruensis]|nr:MAG: hypothetical protein L6R37_005856 [Teloschistes peruensis]